MTADVSMSQRINEVLATYLKRDPDTILPSHHLRDDLGLDSLMTFELLYDLEKTFDLEIPNEDLPGLQTIADVVKYLEGRMSRGDLQTITTPSSTTPSSAVLSSSSKSSQSTSKAKSSKGGRSAKSSTKKVKAAAKPTSKTKPRVSQPVKPPKRAATTSQARTAQKKAKKK